MSEKYSLSDKTLARVFALSSRFPAPTPLEFLGKLWECRMDKSVLKLDKGTTCTAWNYCGQRLAAGSVDGTLAVFDSPDPAASSFRCSCRVKVHEAGILKVVWVPPEYGDAVACIFEDGSFSIWEEVGEDSQALQWKLCEFFRSISSKVLDIQFGVSSTSLKMVAGYSDGSLKVFELTNPLELQNWQLQAEFQNVIDSVFTLRKASCMSASISWNPVRGDGQELSFVMGFNSDTPELNSSKVWEFDGAHQRWLPVAELALPEERGDRVYSIAWAPNIGRPYELIAVATEKGIAIWHLALNPDMDGRLPVERAALLSGHQGEVWQMEWDMSGMTLATTGTDGAVRLWQSNLNGVWQEQGAFVPTS